MEVKKGIAVSPGIAIARALVIDSEESRIPRRSVRQNQVAEEVARVGEAFDAALSELTELEAAQGIEQGQIKDIFAVHMRFLRDRSLRSRIVKMVESEKITAEYAVSTTMRQIAEHFSQVKDQYISERAADIFDLEKRLLRQLLGGVQKDISDISEQVVIVAHMLTPTQTANFNRTFIKGLATDAGGRTSHTAIVARSMGIPAVVGLEDITGSLANGDVIVIDGNHGVVVISPDEDTLAEYERYAKDYVRLEHQLDTIRDLPSVTRDGVEITLLGNIEFPDESELVIEKGGQGIGLYRTEFLYLYSEVEPTEEDHYQAYSDTIRAFKDKPVVIRTLDLGADKFTQSKRFSPEPNPFLGLRSIRFCLQNLPIFKTQLRAILRASVLGNVSIMFPLITNLPELRQARMILRDVMEDLDEDGIKYRQDIRVGIMIETPSAALTAATLAMDSDFFSIGTNDLIQYTLAVDRGNERVSSLYTGAEPAVLRLLRAVVQDAYRAKIGLSICGELASEPEYIMLLLGMGVRTFSLAPPMIPEVKQVIRSVSIDRCNQIARKVLTMNSHRQIENFLRDATRKVLPEMF
jgi:phosphoenolpyruvate-protein phosphotransferase (PTS system enzyme I)